MRINKPRARWRLIKFTRKAILEILAKKIVSSNDLVQICQREIELIVFVSHVGGTDIFLTTHRVQQKGKFVANVRNLIISKSFVGNVPVLQRILQKQKRFKRFLMPLNQEIRRTIVRKKYTTPFTPEVFRMSCSAKSAVLTWRCLLTRDQMRI